MRRIKLWDIWLLPKQRPGLGKLHATKRSWDLRVLTGRATILNDKLIVVYSPHHYVKHSTHWSLTTVGDAVAIARACTCGHDYLIQLHAFLLFSWDLLSSIRGLKHHRCKMFMKRLLELITYIFRVIWWISKAVRTYSYSNGRWLPSGISALKKLLKFRPYAHVQLLYIVSISSCCSSWHVSDISSWCIHMWSN